VWIETIVFEQLRTMLEAKAKRVANPDLHILGIRVANAVTLEVARTSSLGGGFKSYKMLDNLAFVSPTTPSESGYRVGIGKEVAEPSAPSGTIAAFLIDYPQYRRGYADKGSMAWWGLPKEGKRQLAVDRLSGLYGGVEGKSPYWVQQDEGMSSVGIASRNFIDAGVRIIPDEVEKIIKEALRA
jgi:hypothetical protein